VKRLSSIVMLAILLAGVAVARPQSEEPDAPEWAYDAENAEEILETCAGCHGRTGRGGKGGTYPRIAGIDEAYLARQMRAFKTRERVNIPMYPYATERELSPNDVLDISRLFSRMELPTRMPDLPPGTSALVRLRTALTVFNVPPVDGDAERGAEIYEAECSDCHGPEGWGEDDVPQLAGQYTEYLRRQIDGFRSGERSNEDMDGVFESITATDLDDLFAYLASRDD
jgi:cytochrome c553